MGKILIIIFLAASLMANDCNNSKKQNSSNKTNNSNQMKNEKTVSVKGKVTAIQRGKDGYTAEIKTDDGKTYSAVISAVNLAGSGQYREVKVGDTIEVEGEDVMGDGKTIKVTVLK